MTFYKATVVQILEDDQNKARWNWTGFSPGSISKVQKPWIQNKNAPRERQDKNYNHDHDWAIDFYSVGGQFIVRVPVIDPENQTLTFMYFN